MRLTKFDSDLSQSPVYLAFVSMTGYFHAVSDDFLMRTVHVNFMFFQ